MTDPSPITFTWDVACPSCGAAPGRRCRNAYGNRLKFHIARSRAAGGQR